MSAVCDRLLGVSEDAAAAAAVRCLVSCSDDDISLSTRIYTTSLMNAMAEDSRHKRTRKERMNGKGITHLDRIGEGIADNEILASCGHARQGAVSR